MSVLSLVSHGSNDSKLTQIFFGRIKQVNTYKDKTIHVSIASLVAQTVKNLSAMQESWVRSLGWKDTLENRKLPTPVFLPGEFRGQRSLVGYSPWGCKESDTT